MNKYVVATLLSAFLAVPAVLAAPAAPPPPVAPTGTGYYAGAKLGVVKNSTSTAGERSGAFGVFGGYMAGPDFALQIGYTNLGNVDVGRKKITALELSAVATFPINEQFSLLGKLGMANTVQSDRGRTAARLAATYGMAGQFKISPTVGIRFGWDHYSFGGDQIYGSSTTSVVPFYNGNSNLYSVAGVFKFSADETQ